MTAAETLFEAFVDRARRVRGPQLLEEPAGVAILEADPAIRAAVVVMALQRQCPTWRTLGDVLRTAAGVPRDHWLESGLWALLARLLRAALPFSADQIVPMLHALGRSDPAQLAFAGPLRAVERFVAEHGVSPEIRPMLERVRQTIEKHDTYSGLRKLQTRVALMLAGNDDASSPVEPGIWGSEILAWLETLEPEVRGEWNTLLAHAAQASGKSRPSQRYQRRAAELVQAVGSDSFARRLELWFAAARLGPTHRPTWAQLDVDMPVEFGMSDHNQDLLVGLIWAAAALPDAHLAHAVGAFGERCYRKIKDFGPASRRLGNACLVCLSAMPDGVGVVHLSRLAGKVRYASGRQQVERALQGAAHAAGQSREDIEELAVPDFGLDGSGQRRVVLGEHTAEIRIVDGRLAQLGWIRSDGKPQKSVPKAVKESHAPQLKQLKQQVKELKDLLDGQAARMERLWLHDRRLPLHALRARYLEHPVVGPIARTLLWHVTDGERQEELLYRPEMEQPMATLGGDPLQLSDDAEARLWHVLDLQHDLPRLQVWRDYLDAIQLQQPFKQVWREVYRPAVPLAHGDDRFAGHIIRQHPFLNLCQQRGWQYTVQGYWDSHNLPTRDFPRWGIRARLGVDPIDHARDDYIFNYLVTREVSFHSTAGVEWDGALPLEQVPPLLYSEVLRDLDLFVGVSTVANDPNWSEAGVKASWSRYWSDTAWGALAPVALTRREVLARVLPRTTLRDCVTLQDRWLVVGGHRIHLGTANVRREDDDAPQVVQPDRRAKDHVARVFLPFEGDSILSTILAQAFMLADAKGA